MVNVLTNFTQKYANRDIIAGITSRLNQELDITGLPPSFYMNLPELFTSNNKKMVNVFDTISLKNMTNFYCSWNYSSGRLI